MPCDRGLLRNTTLTFGKTKLMDKATLIGALKKLGFTSEQIATSTLNEDIVIPSSYAGGWGDVTFKKSADGYQMTVAKGGLEFLDASAYRKRKETFGVALKKTYAQTMAERLTQSLWGQMSIVETADEVRYVVQKMV